MRKILFSSLILLFATWALPSSAEAVTCPPVGDQIDVRYTVEGTGDTTVTDCTYGADDPNTPGNEGNIASFEDANDADIFGAGWTSYCEIQGNSGTTAPDGCLQGSLTVTAGGEGEDNTWSFTGLDGFEYAVVLKDGNSVNAQWAAFLLADDDTSFEGTWLIEILQQGEWVENDGRLSHFAVLDRPLETTTTPTGTTATPTGTTTPGPIVPEPTLLTLLGGGMLLAGRRLRRKK